jgi:uncharacterized membrane protein YkoI
VVLSGIYYLIERIPAVSRERVEFMTQRVALATAAGLMAFVVVLLGTVGVYVAATNPAGTTALAAPVPPPQDATTSAPAPNNPAPAYPVSAEDAAGIALTSAPGAALAQEPRLVNVNGTLAYEVALDRGVVYVDATSGQVLYNSATGPQPQFRRRGRR